MSRVLDIQTHGQKPFLLSHGDSFSYWQVNRGDQVVGLTDTRVIGLRLYFADSCEATSAQLVYPPMVCIMVQGEKFVALGDKVFRYTPTDSKCG